MKFQYKYTRLHVKDFKACQDFYQNILGLKETFASKIDSYIELTDGTVKLTLLDRNKIQEYLGTKTSFLFEQKSDRIALSFQVEDVEQACQYLEDKGVEIASPPWNVVDWGMKMALVRDPEGNLIELSQMGGMPGAE